MSSYRPPCQREHRIYLTLALGPWSGRRVRLARPATVFLEHVKRRRTGRVELAAGDEVEIVARAWTNAATYSGVEDWIYIHTGEYAGRCARSGEHYGDGDPALSGEELGG